MNNIEELREHCEEMMAISPLRYAYIPASSIITLIERIEKAEAELSAANEKLSKPVKLPKTNGYWDAEEQAFERGIQLACQEIRIAGFRVEGDE